MSMHLEPYMLARAREFSTQQLLTMLAVHAVDHARDMISDMIGDPGMEFLGGVLPNKDDLINQAHIMATEVNVQLGIDEMLDDDTYATLGGNREVNLDVFMELAIRQLIKDNPDLASLNITLK